MKTHSEAGGSVSWLRVPPPRRQRPVARFFSFSRVRVYADDERRLAGRRPPAVLEARRLRADAAARRTRFRADCALLSGTCTCVESGESPSVLNDARATTGWPRMRGASPTDARLALHRAGALSARGSSGGSPRSPSPARCWDTSFPANSPAQADAGARGPFSLLPLRGGRGREAGGALRLHGPARVVAVDQARLRSLAYIRDLTPWQAREAALRVAENRCLSPGCAGRSRRARRATATRSSTSSSEPAASGGCAGPSSLRGLATAPVSTGCPGARGVPPLPRSRSRRRRSKARRSSRKTRFAPTAPLRTDLRRPQPR